MSQTPDPEILKEFLEEYQKYATTTLSPTLAQIRKLFDGWMDSRYWAENIPEARLASPSPINHRSSRIKRPESVVDKILRKESIFPDGLKPASVRKMNDAVAGRVAVYFVSNIPLIHREIVNSDVVEISPEQGPIAYLDTSLYKRLSLQGCGHGVKDSGYASVHYILRFRDGELPPDERPWWELQVRTLTEHVWAEIHHILGYKAEKNTVFAVRKTFQIISSHLLAVDEHFNLLYEELTRFQEQANEQSLNLGDDDLLNAENLPAVLERIGAGCAQREIDGLLRMLNSRGLETVGRLRRVGTPTNIDLIRNTFRSSEGRSPSNFEIVASLAAIVGIVGEEKIVEAIRTQIKFLKAWEEVKKVMGKKDKGPPA